MADDGLPDDVGFARFVTDHRPGLLRTALLLTGDRATAEELVQRALTRTRRAWPAPDPLTTARRALVTGAGRRGVGSEQVIEELPDPLAPAVDEELARALRELPLRTRAATVFRVADGLDPAAVGAVLGVPAAAADAAAAEGAERLRPAVRPDPYRRAQPATEEQRLHDGLARLSGAPGGWRLDAAQAVADVGHRRTGLRRRVLAAATVAAVLLAGAVGALTRPASDRPDPAAGPSAAASAGAEPSGGTSSGAGPSGAGPSAGAPADEPSVRTAPVLTGPARGSLADDPAFLAAVQRADWGGLAAPPVADRTVVFAGDTPSGRAALVVGTVDEDFRGTWLIGPTGASADALVPQFPRGLGRSRPVALLLGGPGAASLVVVTAPGDTIEVSDRLRVGPRGTVGRGYTPVEAVEGVAVVPATTTEDGPALSVRVTREGRLVHRSAVDWPGDRPGRSTPLPELDPVRPVDGEPDARVVAAALVGLAVPLGVEPAELQPELLWSGTLPQSRGPGTVAVVVGRSPGGALVVTTWVGGVGGALACGTATPPGPTPVASLTVVRTCTVERPGRAQPGDGSWLVVTAPPAAAAALVLGPTDRVLAQLPLTGGGTVVALPEGARTVRTVDAAGQLLAQAPVAPMASEPFGDFGSGPQG
ncbi:hypothetical protein [Modestobacter marinus]|uniref:DNA-directed RNA polymerase specialized sigma24 family protein n=1 Tax=Modestobacter marinus TaxID=477641 RepID=A0A846LR86_9ACTN|nr:hypothetical protein [Modestobacter marinus]NIH68792.1 DNA-directed RNA polymerase specialized sigma24 family protein [Modestobacter marinus]GGL60101.1 hypothetical protein GCM10011589_15130 [Modestobacter marinus]